MNATGVSGRPAALDGAAWAQAALAASPDAVVTIDHLGMILDFNRAAEDTFGYPRERAVGRELAELIVPHGLRSAHRAGLARCVKTGESRIVGQRIELPALRADGSEFPAEIAITRAPNEDPPVFIAFIRDLSTRHLREHELRRLAAIVDASDDAIIGKALDGTITSWNSGAEKIYGYTAGEVLGSSIALLVPPEQFDDLPLLLAAIERGERLQHVETDRLRKDGSRVRVSLTISPITAAGEIVGASTIARDISAQTAAAEALRLSEARYRHLVENAEDLIATVDLEHRFTTVNAAFVRALGYSREELIGRRLAEFVPAEWHDELARAAEGKLHGAEATVYEHELVAKDGHRIRVEVASRGIEENGALVGTEAICRDVTERKLLEEQLQQAQRLESVGRLAGGVAHDFNNLLTVIGGYTEALLERADPDSEPALKQIEAAADRAGALTRQLLAFSRRQILQPRIVDLNEIVEGIVPMLRRTIGEDVELVISLKAGLEPVRADPLQIEQILVNLAVNARDAMPDGGTLTIATVCVTLDEDDVAHNPGAHVGPHALVSVADTGSGMDADTLVRLFEPFFTTKPPGAGTGLGLATVYGIVTQSGGTIQVESEPGRGSTFSVYLPIAPHPVTAATPKPHDAERHGGTETILVVEDEEALRALVVRMLESRGFTVVAADSPEHALGLVAERQQPVDVLLTDLVMPQLNGRELARQVTKLAPATRVLFMSGYADRAIVGDDEVGTTVDFVEKPFSATQLSRKLREMLDR